MECYKCLMVCGEKMWASIAKLPFFYTFLAFCNLTNCCILHLTILLRFYTFFFCSLSFSVVAKGALEILPLFNQLFCGKQKKVRCDKISTNSGLVKKQSIKCFCSKVIMSKNYSYRPKKMEIQNFWSTLYWFKIECGVWNFHGKYWFDFSCAWSKHEMVWK